MRTRKKRFLTTYGKFWQVATKIGRPKFGNRVIVQLSNYPENLDIVASKLSEEIGGQRLRGQVFNLFTEQK